MKDMLTHVTDAFGRMGVSEIQIGSQVIPVKSPDELDKIEGFGDTIHKGDIVSRLDGTPAYKVYPFVIEAIIAPGPGEDSPSLLTRRVDEGPLQKRDRGPTHFNVFGTGWRSSFKRLDQNALNRWFEETKGPRHDGWHKHPDIQGVEFRTFAGVPLEVKCGTLTYKHVAEEVGRITGYDLKLSGRFSDKKARLMKVAKVTRREPPKVPSLFIVRLFDMLDGWIDVAGPMPEAEAKAYWNEKTINGTKNTKYEDGDYWHIFPEGTRMLITPEFLGR